MPPNRRGKSVAIHKKRVSVGPKSGLDAFSRRKMSYAFPGIEPRFLGLPSYRSHGILISNFFCFPQPHQADTDIETRVVRGLFFSNPFQFTSHNQDNPAVPVHALLFCSLRHILMMSRSSSRRSRQSPACIYFLSNTCYMPLSSHIP